MNEKLEKKEEKPVMTTIKEMEIGENASFPIIKMHSVKTTAVTVSTESLGSEHPKKFKTKINREQKIITVTRVM